MLTVVGWTDVGLLYWPPQFGRPEWEFGIIASTFDTLPVALTGMMLVGVGMRARGSAPALVKAFGVVCVVVALVCLILLGIFALDIPVAWRAMQGSLPGAQGAAHPNPVEIAGLKRGVAKALVFGLGYGAAFLLMGLMLWRGAGMTQPRSETSEG